MRKKFHQNIKYFLKNKQVAKLYCQSLHDHRVNVVEF